MTMNAQAFRLALLATLALGGCDKAAQGNSNASGSPGAGNPREFAAPAAPDTPPGGSSGRKGSMPHPGSSGGDAVPGTTGRGTSDPGGRSQSAQAGVGTAGGLGGSSGLGMTGSFPASGASSPAQPGPDQGGGAPAGSSNGPQGNAGRLR